MKKRSESSITTLPENLDNREPLTRFNAAMGLLVVISLFVMILIVPMAVMLSIA